MTNRENVLNVLRRKGYTRAIPFFELCPQLIDLCEQETGMRDYNEYFNIPIRMLDIWHLENNEENFGKLFDYNYNHGTYFDKWGVGFEPGSKEAFHMTRFLHPLKKCLSIQEMKDYPWPVFNENSEYLTKLISDYKDNDLVVVGSMAATIFERSWYIRGMEELMMDMMCEDEMAIFVLDYVTAIQIKRAEEFVRCGVDILFLGDDIGMQESILLSEELYCKWIKPRQKAVIDAAKKINPNVLIKYHSCGYIIPFIPHLIEIGVDILNPIQPECMNFEDIHNKYKDKLSFWGVIGTQSTMPFGSADEVKAITKKALDIAGDQGGLIACPTHLLEPEVPWENIVAYAQEISEYKKS